MRRNIPGLQRRASKVRRGFSLFEMLIAIVILGFGLVMIATMFPVAWRKARELTEYTSQVAAAEGAHTIVKLLTRVDGFASCGSSFAGDLVFEHTELGTCQNGGDSVIAKADTRVHALHLENILLTPPAGADRPFVPSQDKPWTEVFSPWKLEKVDSFNGFETLNCSLIGICNGDLCNELFTVPQVAFESRVQPPMPVWDELEGDEEKQSSWYENLDTRRFAWAVFHRLRKQIRPDPASGLTKMEQCELARDNADASRDIDFYYVTLRRPNSTLRFARQDPDSAPDPEDLDAPPMEPAALGPDQDVLFPSPWRVQVLFPDVDPDPDNRTGIPSQIEVNTSDIPTADFVVEMFDIGAQFIDERNGELYRVTGRRLMGDDLDEAIVTLDREVLFADLDDQPLSEGVLVIAELRRTVWVFPPSVQGVRDGGDPVFDGKQPVVGVDIRTLTISPTR